jgi:hypothetical protein
MRSNGAIKAAIAVGAFMLCGAIVQVDYANAAQKKPAANLAAQCRQKAGALAPGRNPSAAKQRGALFRQCMQNGGKI